jgi:hypothetical protein
MFNLLLALAVMNGISPEAVLANVSEPNRSGSELCEEVEYEINLSVTDGLLPREEANKIIKRCYEIYGNQ